MLDIDVSQSGLFGSHEVFRPDLNDTSRLVSIATGVMMSIQPQASFDDPSRVSEENPPKQYKAYVVPKNSAITELDIVRSMLYGDLVVVNVLDFENTNVMELELETQR